jgi:hypothetical protein
MGFYWITTIVWGLLLLILSSLVFGTAFLMKGITPEEGISTPMPQPIAVEATAIVVDAIPVDLEELDKELQR